jgi:CRISPR-associated protein Csb2
MPNNDSDAIGGDPARVAKIRTATKTFRPYFFDAAVPFIYVWPLEAQNEDEAHAAVISSLAERLYQLGRGIDMAWAWGEVMEDRQLEELLLFYPGRIFRPGGGKGETALAAPCLGSLASLLERHHAFSRRFRYVQRGRSVQVVFRKPPRPRFRLATYENPPSRLLYELRSPVEQGTFAPWPLERASQLVVRLRDAAVERLKNALPARSADIERVLVGRKPDGTNDCRPEDRVRMIPLPSIGHYHADRAIRRVLVEVPGTCALRSEDVHWAISGLDLVDDQTGEVDAVVVQADNDNFLRHYGLHDQRPARLWCTVTPAALPESAKRRRIDPARQRDEAKAGSERMEEQARAVAAVCHALRHAGVRVGVEGVRVQREPFDAKGERAESFAAGTRFAKERLWHVQIRFHQPVAGPLVIGDGRFLGLGLMRPIVAAEGVHAFAIDSHLHGAGNGTWATITRAIRRALMARAQATIGEGNPLPTFFSGHQPDGKPANSEQQGHLAIVFDPLASRVLVVAPHALERRRPSEMEQRYLAILEDALAEMRWVTAGSAGVLELRPVPVWRDADPLFAASKSWESVTPYCVNRHARAQTATAALAADLRAECVRRGLPIPSVEVLECWSVPRLGLSGRVRLHFEVAVDGPLLLGKTRYAGGGLFRGVSPVKIER